MGYHTCNNLCESMNIIIRKLNGKTIGYINYNKYMYCKECEYVALLSGLQRCPCCSNPYRRTSHT